MRKAKLVLLAGVSIASLPAAAHAQGGADGARPSNGAGEAAGDRFEEIVVTAQKRTESLVDVPIAISALSGRALDHGTAEGVAEALRAVPGVATVSDRNALGTQVIVRGVAGGGLFSGSGAPIAYYLDSVPFGLVRTAIAPDSTAYDLERVEVLRGPQGTLYGASALNGVVRILTKDVDLDTVELKARGMTSLTRHGGWNYRSDAAVNVPISEGKLALRVTGGYQDFSGWIDRVTERDANDAEAGNVRFKLKAQPTDALTIGLSTWISRADYGAPNTGDADRFHASTVAEPSSVDYDVYAFNVDYDLGLATLSSATSYLEYEAFNILDYGPFCGVFCTGFTQTNTLSSEVLTEELLLNSSHEGPWRWSIGGFFRDVSDESEYVFPGSPPGGFDDTSQSLAFFGEVTRGFGDGRFELTGGLRHFRDRVRMRDRAPGSTIADRATFESTTPRVVLTWHTSRDATVYASYSQGFRSGVVQTPEVITVGFPPAKPDKLTNYEIGAKADLLDRKLSVELAGYFIDWKNIQQNLSVPIGNTFYAGIVNGPGASGVGIDFSITARPAEGVSLGVTSSYNDLGFDSDVLTSGVTLFNEGERPNQSPELTLSGFAQYELALGGGYTGTFGASANYTSEVTLRNVINGARIVSPSESLLIGGASFTLSAPASWQARLFVDNVTDEQGVALSSSFPDPFSTTRSFIPSWDARPRPRTFGLQIDFRY